MFVNLEVENKIMFKIKMETPEVVRLYKIMENSQNQMGEIQRTAPDFFMGIPSAAFLKHFG